MENRSILIDTSIVIDHLRKSRKDNTLLTTYFEKYTLFTSTITVFELYVGATDKRKYSDIEKILSQVAIIDFNRPIAQNASIIFNKLKFKNQLIDYRDLFIAATAIANNIPLATLNIKHFERVEELKLAPMK